MTDIGRAGIVMKGDYNSASTYETLDAVSFSNALYIAKQNVPAGTNPSNTTYWQLATDATGKADILHASSIPWADAPGTTQEEKLVFGLLQWIATYDINGVAYLEWHQLTNGILVSTKVSEGSVYETIFTNRWAGALYYARFTPDLTYVKVTKTALTTFIDI